jgi:uncharacterized membrane protein (DUF2068 family)
MMESETKTAPSVSTEPAAEVHLKRAPTFYVIIFFKIAKGLLAGFLSVVLYFQPANQLPTEYEQLMGRPAVKEVFHYLRIHPENKFFEHLAEQIANATDAGVRAAAVGALLWSLFPLTEGIGMIFRVRWAGWLAIGESAFFVPVEIFKLVEAFTWFMVVVTLINMLIVWYLYTYRERLFYEAHHYRNLRHPDDTQDHPIP